MRQRFAALLVFAWALLVVAPAAWGQVAFKAVSDGSGQTLNAIGPGDVAYAVFAATGTSAVVQTASSAVVYVSNPDGGLTATAQECDDAGCDNPSNEVTLSASPQKFKGAHLRINVTGGTGTVKVRGAQAGAGFDNSDEVDQTFLDSPAADLTDAGSTEVITAAERDQLSEYFWMGGIGDTSVTSGHCMHPQVWHGGSSGACGTNVPGSPMTGTVIPNGMTLTVTEFFAVSWAAIKGAGEECQFSLASGSLGTATPEDETDLFWSDASAASVTARTGIADPGDYVKKTGLSHVVTGDGDDWVSVRMISIENATCTGAGEPVACCVGANDATGCVCSGADSVNWTITYNLE